MNCLCFHIENHIDRLNTINQQDATIQRYIQSEINSGIRYKEPLHRLMNQNMQTFVSAKFTE